MRRFRYTGCVTISSEMAFSTKRRRLWEPVNGESLSQENGSSRPPTKCFSDPAIDGGLIELNEACVKVINTPEFGRLHYIKQTGGCYLVYPSATHTRFEHSLGTCYLAGEVLRRLRQHQPELDINDRDVLAVELAALCHDLGHGAFSHTFDQMFIPLAAPNEQWEHEDASIMMFRHLLTKNPSVKEYLDQILEERDYVFIKEAIRSVDEKHSEWPYRGRPFEKAFLYDVVANKTHGFDVDKWDYIIRDALHTKVATNANIQRLLKNLRVMPVGRAQRPTICYRDKVREDLENLATTRAVLHKTAYQHLTVKVIEVMMVDALLEADKYLQFKGTNGILRLSETIHDMEAYCHVTDDILFGDIRRSTSPELQAARDILKRIMERRLYAKLAQVELDNPEENKHFRSGMCKRTVTEIAEQLKHCNNTFPHVDEEDLERNLVVMVSDIHRGMKDEDPVSKVWFYRKQPHTRPIRFTKRGIDSRWRPPRQKIIRVFCRKDDDDLIECAQQCFKLWCETKGLTQPRDITESDENDYETQYDSRPGSMQKEEISFAFSTTPQLDSVRRDLSRQSDFQRH